MSDADIARLRDILAAIETVQRYCVRVSEARFLTDYVLQDAVVRRVTIVGEAASRLSTDARQALAEIEWTSIISMRHILVHDYSDVDQDTLWKTVRHDLPELRKRLLRSVDFVKGVVTVQK